MIRSTNLVQRGRSGKGQESAGGVVGHRGYQGRPVVLENRRQDGDRPGKDGHHPEAPAILPSHHDRHLRQDRSQLLGTTAQVGNRRGTSRRVRVCHPTGHPWPAQPLDHRVTHRPRLGNRLA